MDSIEKRMEQALKKRRQAGLQRELPSPVDGHADFCSNDYLGLARTLPDTIGPLPGATGSRLLSGNSRLAEDVEQLVADFHHAEAALLFSSGYAANIGLLPAVVSRQDTIIYDKLLHASLRDGIKLTQARAFSFAHNDLRDFAKKLAAADGEKWVVVESVYSMDGDQAPLVEIAMLCQDYGANLIVDEAHGTGVIGEHGEGAVRALELEDLVWARVHTFGKAVGSHGAAVLGTQLLKTYLINFARSFIYTTALPPVTLAHIKLAYGKMAETGLVQALHERVQYFLGQCPDQVRQRLISSNTPIQAVLCPGNAEVQALAKSLQEAGMGVLPIRYPTVPRGEERLRVCLHTFNTNEEIDRLLFTLSSCFR
ncbi:MAG: 8-amino-7-oxononanoate synthase [Phaeodactylibacter sp.]|uniref:aminotransferase class I/II-fold pyridoxal phosphate-dependent enzyme n=1 Tax=Phaeodactylibacter sp. TaxID=1940289 RepID=UPI0032ECDD31